MQKMDPEMLLMVLDTLGKLEKDKLPLDTKLDLDHTANFPMDLIRFMVGPEVGLHLIFVPEEYGGMGAGAEDIAILSEKMAKMDMAVATSFLAICLGMDPILVGATPAQKQKYLTKIAEEGMIVAYCVTEPEAGSNVQSLKTKAERILDSEGQIVAYKINGEKQFITNGRVADLYTVLADTPEGPSFFIVEAGTPGLIPGKHEDKHGIRASDTSPVTLQDLCVPAENLVGGVEGQGLKQANQVFGYTRLMVAAFGLGAGMAALERAVAYGKDRIQFGTRLVDKQGYTHKLLVPHIVELEAARAYIEKVAQRLDSNEEDLQVEGAVAKYFATEAGDAAANDGIQAFGGYGYMREYEVEKIKRDVKITTIYEGTSEILQNVISMFRMRESVRTKGRYYLDMADKLAGLPTDTGAHWVAASLRVLADAIQVARELKLTKSQHVMFLLSDIMTWGEVAAALCHKAAGHQGGKKWSAEFMKAAARVFARDTVELAARNASKILRGCDPVAPNAERILAQLPTAEYQTGLMKDLDLVTAELVR
ncbi:MAG: acyl-CoA dehydrogenase [Acidobacteria bacterium]|nr:MAG: acyl-CoA dehydrogenase [Acidobacteriota bacterium]